MGHLETSSSKLSPLGREQIKKASHKYKQQRIRHLPGGGQCYRLSNTVVFDFPCCTWQPTVLVTLCEGSNVVNSLEQLYSIHYMYP